jgi:glycosyltransferase involved in cell wall biosynthesis
MGVSFMHILIVHQYYLHPDGGGGSRWNQFSKYWSEKGHKITVLGSMLELLSANKYPAYKGKYIVTKEEMPNVFVKRCHVSEAYNKSFIGRAWGYFSFVFSSIIAGLSVKKPDVIICTSPPLTVGLVGWVLSRCKRIPMVFEVRDLWPESAIDTGVVTNGVIIKMMYWLEKKSYNKAKWINVLTPAFKTALIEKKGIPSDMISLIPNGADLDIIKPGPRDNYVRKKYNLSDKFVVTYVGAHGLANSLMQLIEAAKLLKQKDSCVQIVMVGDGMEREKLFKAVEQNKLDNVTMIGPVSKAEISDYINASDVCTAVLKKCDTFKTVYPNKVFDYMSAEKPIIVGIDGVARQLVEEAQVGIFAEPENPHAFVDAVLKLKNSPELMLKYGKNGRIYATENFPRQKLAEKYLGILEKLVSSNSS